MKKLFSLVLVSFLLIANSYAGRWDDYYRDPSMIVAQDGNMIINLSASTLTTTLPGEGSETSDFVSVRVETANSYQSFSWTLTGDSHFSISDSRNVSAYYGVKDLQWHFENSTIDPELGWVSLPAGVYTAVLTVEYDNNSISCLLTATVGNVPAAAPVLDGLFSVSADKQVKFSRGNLFWNGSAWGLEANQTEHPTDRTGDHMGHFFWAANAADATDWTLNATPNVDDHHFCDGSDAEHTLSIEGVDGFRALSQAEWVYLMETRPNAANLHYLPAFVNNVKGCLLIAPDNWDGLWKTTYTLAEIEAEGLVCLPPTGRYNTYSYMVDYLDELLYWTSTPSGEYASYQLEAGYDRNDTWMYYSDYIAQVSRESLQALRLVVDPTEEEEEGPEGGPDGPDGPGGPTEPVATTPVVLGSNSIYFTVDASGKKVQFTRGNLFWNGTTWKMEVDQLSAPATYNANHVGHFYWSSSADVAVAEEYLDNAASSSDNFFCDEAHALTIQDINASDVTGLYNLSKAEWEYLLGSYNARFKSEQLRKFPVTIAGIENCLVIAPDLYMGTLKAEYTAEEWAAAEADSGLVCLPLAGYRTNTTISTEALDSYLSNYWTGTSYYYSWSAYPVAMSNDSYSPITTSYGQGRENGLPVRLVKTYVAPAEDPLPAVGEVLPGIFRVNHNKYIQFTRGNLFWDGENWGIESQQMNRTRKQDLSHQDQFYWATTADDAHAATFNNSVPQTQNDHMFCDGSDAEHMLAIAGQENLFALTSNEWDYLLRWREHAYDLYRYPVTVCGLTNCAILAPDGYEGVLKDSYTRDEFVAAQAAGLVVFPPTGYRNTTGSYSYNEYQPYSWIATVYSNRDTYGNYMYAFESEGTGTISGVGSTNRNNRLPIRLVQEHVYPMSEYKVKVNVPQCDGEHFVPGISGNFNSFQVEKLIPTNEDGWYTFTFKAPTADATGVFFITEYKLDGNLTHNHLREAGSGYVPGLDSERAVYFTYDCSADDTFVEDLSEAYWTSCSTNQAKTNRVREVHFYLPKPVAGGAIPNRLDIKVVKQDGINAAGYGEPTEQYGDINIYKSGYGVYSHTNYVEGSYYYFYCYASSLNSYGSLNDARYFWHIGDQPVEETASYTSPNIWIQAVEFLQHPNDVTMDVAGSCSLTVEANATAAHTFSQMENFPWRIIIDGEDEPTHNMGQFSVFEWNFDDHNSTLSFPATALPAGQYQFYSQYGASVDGNIYDPLNSATHDYLKVINSRKATVIIKEGTLVNIGAGAAPAPKRVSGPRKQAVSYDVETGTTILEDAATDAAEVQSVVCNNEKNAVIKLQGTNTLAASRSGIETAESIVVVGAAGSRNNTITSPKAFYTPRLTSEVVLTLRGLYVELIGEAGSSVISGFSALKLEDCEILSPVGAHYDTDARELVDSEGNKVTHAVIGTALTPDYTREGLSEGKIGTICLPNAVAAGDFTGATFYEVVYATEDFSTIYFDAVSSLEAGVPYVFIANDTKIECYYTGDAVATAGSKNGLVGSFTQAKVDNDGYNYVIVGNQYHKAGSDTYVGANRAYLRLCDITTEAPAGPAHSRISLSRSGTEIVTSIEDMDNDIVPVKMIKDGQIYILRGGKMYHIDGQIVK